MQTWQTKAGESKKKVNEARASAVETKSRGRVLDALMRLKTSGRVSGFHGRLGTLGTIPEQYDVAITTACGALNNMVVDTVEDAQACIKHLREQNVGRASFMVLEKLSPSRGQNNAPTPEGAPRLINLITSRDAKFMPAFEKAVGETLVAKSLDQANKIAFDSGKRWRVVTIQGQLIDTSGTMGGGGRPASGGMSSKFSPEGSASEEDIKSWERDANAAENKVREAQGRMEEARTEVDRREREGPQIDMEIQKLNMDIQMGKQRLSDSQRRLKEAE